MTTACHARFAALMGIACLLGAAEGRAQADDDLFDHIDDALTFGSAGEAVRARVSGTLDLEGIYMSQPEEGLVFSDGNAVLVPRLSLFVDAQVGPRLYAFVQARADNGFDPGEEGPHLRLDEYVLRLTPWDDGRLSVQVGKFATVVGNWTPRHGSWENPFITAPLPYENVTGIWDTNAVRSATELMVWAGVSPRPNRGGAFLVKYRNVPIIWGPSYASGASIFGAAGRLEYAFEVKNTSLSSRPETWSPTDTQWQNPTFSGRIAYVPNEMWTLGFSASTGAYLQGEAQPGLLSGVSLDRYTEVLVGQDLGFAWHHFQVWAEAFEARFEIPGVGSARTQACYVEAKYKFTPQFFGALRWNQQAFSALPIPGGGSAPWSRDTWRLDVGPGYRFTPHTQIKLQCSIEHQDADSNAWSSLVAVQFTARF